MTRPIEKSKPYGIDFKERVTVVLRLLPDIDARLRAHIRRRGDVSAFVLAMLHSVDLWRVPVIRITFKEENAVSTACKLAANDYGELKRIARARQCSINALLNSAIGQYADTLRMTSPNPKRTL